MTTKAVNAPAPLKTLEVLGIGLSVEMFRQSQVWQKIQQNTEGSALPSDWIAYPTKFAEREKAADLRGANALTSALKYFVKGWPIPSVNVCPLNREQSAKDTSKGNSDFFNNQIDNLRQLAGLSDHKIATLGTFFRDDPEEVLERAFQFFDGFPNVPALLLMVSDGDVARKLIGDETRKAHWDDGKRKFNSMADTAVALLLGRRERLDALRPFMPPPQTALHAAGKAPPGFKPSKYLPEPWTYEQLRQFDQLPTIAILHRPIRISYRKDEDGIPTFDINKQVGTMYSQQRETIFKAGFDAALQLIPDAKPARVFYDTGGAAFGGHIIPLAQATTDSLPEFDLFEPDEGIDINARLGNTGAASPFVQWALACITAVHEKDASITANLRQKEEAMITVITPYATGRNKHLANFVDSHMFPEMFEEAPASDYTKDIPAFRPIYGSQTTYAESTRNIPLGTQIASGEECPQSGVWQCSPQDADGGSTHFIPQGRTFPKIVIIRELAMMQKLRGESAREKVTATWTLISYDHPKT